jgi:hypothetical protein
MHPSLSQEERVDIAADELLKFELSLAVAQQKFETEVLRREKAYRIEIKQAFDVAQGKCQDIVKTYQPLTDHVVNP